MSLTTSRCGRRSRTLAYRSVFMKRTILPRARSVRQFRLRFHAAPYLCSSRRTDARRRQPFAAAAFSIVTRNCECVSRRQLRLAAVSHVAPRRALGTIRRPVGSELKNPPSHFFKSPMLCLGRMRRRAGEIRHRLSSATNGLIFSTDFPHVDTKYPKAVERFLSCRSPTRTNARFCGTTARLTTA